MPRPVVPDSPSMKTIGLFDAIFCSSQTKTPPGEAGGVLGLSLGDAGQRGVGTPLR
jgi:hypothetical protein